MCEPPDATVELTDVTFTDVCAQIGRANDHKTVPRPRVVFKFLPPAQPLLTFHLSELLLLLGLAG